MNKAELVAQVAKESDLSKDAAEKAVDATFKNIEKALKGGDTVRIVETRPLSKDKRWRLLEIVERAR